jgi:hypothetical protein
LQVVLDRAAAALAFAHGERAGHVHRRVRAAVAHPHRFCRRAGAGASRPVRSPGAADEAFEAGKLLLHRVQPLHGVVALGERHLLALREDVELVRMQVLLLLVVLFQRLVVVPVPCGFGLDFAVPGESSDGGLERAVLWEKGMSICYIIIEKGAKDGIGRGKRQERKMLMMTP